MSEAKKDYSNRRTVGKRQVREGRYGQFEEVLVDQSPTNKDGSPNPFFAGKLYWVDAKTGLTYEVKKLKMTTPRDGMHPKMQELGFTHFINLDLDDSYSVVVQE